MIVKRDGQGTRWTKTLLAAVAIGPKYDL
jgi:hypothetical protein